VSSKCSGEVEIICPVDPALLVVQGWSDSELDRRMLLDQLNRNEEAAIENHRIRGYHVDLLRCVGRLLPAGSSSSKRVAPNHENLVDRGGPLALHTKKPGTNIEDHVVATPFRHGAIVSTPSFKAAATMHASAIAPF
jgi:hypothetical protein